MRHGVHAHCAVVGLAKGLGLLAQLVIGGGDEVIPGEKGQFALLGEGGRLAEGEPGGDTGASAGSRVEKLTSTRDRSIVRRHPGPPSGSMGDRTSRENPAGRVSPPRGQVVATLYPPLQALSRGARPELPSRRALTRPSCRMEDSPRRRHVEKGYSLPAGCHRHS